MKRRHTFSNFARTRVTAVCATIATATLGVCLSAGAQQRMPGNSSTSPSSADLSQQNMNFVGASPSQIKDLLVQAPGLMVELKRWVAQDATNHGQVIVKQDLTDGAIFDRLENDPEFCSAATRILQQFGYLLPEVNPNSPMAKQAELVMQERVKLIAQQEEQEQQRQLQASLAAQACANPSDPTRQNCPDQQASPIPALIARPSIGPIALPQQTQPNDFPTQPSFPTLPPLGLGSLQRASLTQDSGQSGAGLGMLGLAPSNNIAQALSNSDSGGSDASVLQRLGGAQFGGGALSSLLADGGSDLTSLLPNGGGLSSLFAGGNTLPGDTRPPAAIDSVSPAHPFGSSVVPIDSFLGVNQIAAAEPRMIRASSPYRDIPSLYDMYLQASPRPTEPTRFGSQVFANGTRDPQLIPTDLPAGPDYVVGPGDGLSIDLWGGVSQRVYRTVDREGRIELPEAGPMLVSGKNLEQIQQEMQSVMRHVYRDESADVSLSRLRTIRIYEVGDVANPGAYDISSLSTPLNALFAAGGPTAQGSLRIVKHYRGDTLVEEVDLYDLLLRGVRSGMARLENGDTVMVPPLGTQVTVEGMVRRPAIYELKDEKSLSAALELAGGLLPAATLRHIEVQRLVAHEKQTMLSVDLPEGDGTADITRKLDAFQIQDGDRIRIYPIAPYNQDAVYLEGHVLRPGRYSYRDNMRVTDVIGSFKDLLPEPATEYAEIIRLNAPDFHPSVESFSIADVLHNPADAPLLKPMDTVRIFSRYEFQDPPTVNVAGDVRDPGKYPTSGQIHVADAVYLAGGLSPDASLDDAQVFRYLPDGESKIFSVNLASALSGNPAANIVLESRDRLLIHKSPQAIQPATVLVQGAIGRPGRYPLTTNMTVADLIRVGGGLKPSADTESADLTHYAYSPGPGSKLTGDHQPVAIAAVLSGDANSNIAVSDGDVLTIRELPGWNDIGASITLKGEVKHPGTYGIKPGERLSSVIERAGGLQPDAYPYGAVLQRTEVQDLETKQQDELILRLKAEKAQLDLLPENDDQTRKAKVAAIEQFQQTLTQLSANPPVGRVAIQISSSLDRWKNTTTDPEVHAGDTLTMPKRPGYVMVSGQVFNPTAISYRQSRSAKWYLSQAGGPTSLANKKAIFVIRADGSVITTKQGLLSGDGLDATLRPGDTVVVPERAIGGPPNWQNLFTAAQLATSIANTAFLIAHY
jgi:protein involved in polysaccharide export with SLBB domain